MNLMDEPRFDLRALVEEAGLKSWDYALPIDWCTDVHRRTGFRPERYGFVWCYDKPRVWGEPVALTHAAKILLHFYETVRYTDIVTIPVE